VPLPEAGHNGKENPIGIETELTDLMWFRLVCHNGKENPIGIETHLKHRIDDISGQVTMEKKTR